VGSLRDCTWILGLADYRVIGLESQMEFFGAGMAPMRTAHPRTRFRPA
jgi:hypothetical protein